MSVVALQLAAAGTSIGAGVLTLVVPVGLVFVVLTVWWLALRRSRSGAAAAAAGSAIGGEETPPAQDAS
jgi:hypothetical protein